MVATGPSPHPNAKLIALGLNNVLNHPPAALARPLPRGKALELRRLPPTFWAGACSLGAATAASVLLGWSEARTMVLLMVLLLPVGLIAIHSARADQAWLSNLIVVAWIVKLVASSARYWVLQVLYQGAGDASGYHSAGRRLGPVWRSFDIPAFETGTEFVDAVTGLLYVPHEPTKLGGFFIYATLAFFGQILLYAAFRRAFPTAQLKWYAGLIFFFPNLLYWPASIGKDSLMLLFIGISAYGAARFFHKGRLRWMLTFALGVGGSAAIRSHIALALVIALLIASLFGSKTPFPASGRIVPLILLVALVFIVGRIAFQDLGVDPNAQINQSLLEEVVDPVFGGVEDQTNKGGSAVSGRAVRSPADVPAAALRVLVRPLPNEAHNPQALVSSLVEGTLLLALLLWRAPMIIRRATHRWRTPYVLFSVVYTAGFIYGHSAILNLGIMARQRSQVIPFVLALLVGLGFTSASRTAAEDPAAARHARVLVD